MRSVRSTLQPVSPALEFPRVLGGFSGIVHADRRVHAVQVTSVEVLQPQVPQVRIQVEPDVRLVRPASRRPQRHLALEPLRPPRRAGHAGTSLTLTVSNPHQVLGFGVFGILFASESTAVLLPPGPEHTLTVEPGPTSIR